MVIYISDFLSEIYLNLYYIIKCAVVVEKLLLQKSIYKTKSKTPSKTTAKTAKAKTLVKSKSKAKK